MATVVLLVQCSININHTDNAFFSSYYTVVSSVHGHAYPKYQMLKVIRDEVLSVQFTVFSGYVFDF